MDNTELIFESANMLVSNCNQKLYQHEARFTISSFAAVLNHACSSMCAAAYAICYYCSFRIFVDIMVKSPWLWRMFVIAHIITLSV